MNALKKENNCKIYKHKFKLANSPNSVQLTIHINNMLLSPWWDKKEVMIAIKTILEIEKPKYLYVGKGSAYLRFNQIVDYYGIEFCKSWFNKIYGWDIKNV